MYCFSYLPLVNSGRASTFVREPLGEGLGAVVEDEFGGSRAKKLASRQAVAGLSSDSPSVGEQRGQNFREATGLQESCRTRAYIYIPAVCKTSVLLKRCCYIFPVSQPAISNCISARQGTHHG